MHGNGAHASLQGPQHAHTPLAALPSASQHPAQDALCRAAPVAAGAARWRSSSGGEGGRHPACSKALATALPALPLPFHARFPPRSRTAPALPRSQQAPRRAATVGSRRTALPPAAFFNRGGKEAGSGDGSGAQGSPRAASSANAQDTLVPDGAIKSLSPEARRIFREVRSWGERFLVQLAALLEPGRCIGT